jgi:hypothetical protein
LEMVMRIKIEERVSLFIIENRFVLLLNELTGARWRDRGLSLLRDR